jgi:hypothetical protein
MLTPKRATIPGRRAEDSKPVKVNGLRGHLTLAAGAIVLIATTFVATFTWRVFDSLLSMGRLEDKVEAIHKQLPVIEARLVKKIDEAVGDNIERIRDLEKRHEGVGH